MLYRYGLAETTQLEFSGMLDGNTRMHLPAHPTDEMSIVDDRGKELMKVLQSGERISDAAFIASLSTEYVKFSGKTFPDILVPLMRSANAMINPARPLVIYKDMAIQFNENAFDVIRSEDKLTKTDESGSSSTGIRLKSGDHGIDVNGRKGKVKLVFTIESDGIQIGRGVKNMLLSGLRDYDDDAMMEIVAQYNQWREDYSPN